MKKLLILWLLLFPIFGFTYQQQGFSQYQENFWSVNFVCAWQCVMLVGQTDQYDMITANWQLSGQGFLGYWFLVGQQIIPWETMQINGNGIVAQDFIFARSQTFSQIPANSQIVIILEGNINGTIKPSLDVLGGGQKIAMAWNDFREMETLTPYSINLRYGVKLLWTSIVQYGYWIFILVALYILVFAKRRKEQKYQRIFFWGIGIFLFIGARNLISYTRIVDQWLKNYTQSIGDNKTFFDLWDYIVFTDKVRKELKLDEGTKTCKIQINSFQDRPFTAHRESVYLKPCISVKTWSLADYILYYKKPISKEDLQKPVLINFNGSYLLQNK